MQRTFFERLIKVGPTDQSGGEPDLPATNSAPQGFVTTSCCVGDPVLAAEVALVLGSEQFDVIHFNNGLLRNRPKRRRGQPFGVRTSDLRGGPANGEPPDPDGSPATGNPTCPGQRATGGVGQISEGWRFCAGVSSA